MSETTGEPSAAAGAAEAGGTQAAAAEAPELSIRSLIAAGVHFGHQTSRWNPRMRSYLFGERNGIHIIDLDQSLPRFREALDFLRDTTAAGGKVLFVGTKRQAAPTVQMEAMRAEQYYVNNRWLGGMLTNWKTVKKSIDRYKAQLEICADEEKQALLSKKEFARVVRQCEKYAKSLEGIKEMSRVPDALFVLGVQREQIAVSEAQRLGIPIVAIVDSNCNPFGIDYVVPGNDDSMRAIRLYCQLVAEACIEGAVLHQESLVAEGPSGREAGAGAPPSGRRVVEIHQPPRRGRGRTSRAHSAGGYGRDSEDSAPTTPAVPPPVATPPPAVEPQAAAPDASAKTAEASEPSPPAAAADADTPKVEG